MLGMPKAPARQCDFAVHRGRHGEAGEIVNHGRWVCRSGEHRRIHRRNHRRHCAQRCDGGAAGGCGDAWRVKCLIGATPAAIIYASDTAGEPSATAGTKSAIVGKAIAADVLFVNVQQVALS